MAMIALASVAGQWNDVLPSHLSFANYANALTGDVRRGAAGQRHHRARRRACWRWSAAPGRRSLCAPCVAVPRRVLETLFFIPSAVPSVSVGLGLLVAFSQPPVLLNGTVAIVMIAHFVLVSAFTFGNVSAGLSRLPPDFEQVAASLGARPAYRLRRVTLPMLLPYLIAAFSLSFAMSMGELGATVMVYPPGWVTLPVGIFALSDRGDVFEAAALTMILAFATLLVLVGLSRIPTRAEQR